ncbi:MAG: hypothetical protein LBC18_10610 [Opitutaceae bacterium]|jgi:hypothetical protein|nr:hypothetical protein [Opitutaceae bacterium]
MKTTSPPPYAHRVILPACMAAMGILASGAFAATLAWEFDEKQGTTLGAVQNSAGQVLWSGNLAESAVTGRGTLRLRNLDTEKCRSFARLGQPGKDGSTWLVVNIARWQFIDGVTRSTGVGLAQGADPKFTMLAEMNLQGSADRGFFVSGDAMPENEGASGTKAFRLGDDTGGEPLTLALEYLPETNRFNLYRGGAGGRLALLGGGKTSRRRDARYACIYIKNAVGAVDDEYIELGGLAVTTGRGTDGAVK